VIAPHGFGLESKGVAYMANVDRLTKKTQPDWLAGTLLHRNMPCREGSSG
jgi:hypothetical protein